MDAVHAGLITLLLLAFLFILAFVLRRGQRALQEPLLIRTIAAKSLSGQTALHLLEVDGRRVLLGVSRAGVTALGQWQTPATRLGPEER